MVSYTLAKALNWGDIPVEQGLGLRCTGKGKKSRRAKNGGAYL